MDAFPSASLEHNVPFLLVTGFSSSPPELPFNAELQDNHGLLFRSEQPPIDTREAKLLRSYLGEVDEEGSSWVAIDRDEPYRLRIKTAGRVW